MPQPPSDKVAEYCPLGQTDKIRLNLAIIRGFLTQPTRSGAVCSDQDAMKFLMICKNRQLNPFEGDAYLVGYDSKDGPVFSTITAHQAFLKRAEAHPDFDGMESGVIVNDNGVIQELEGDFYMDGQVVVGAWATIYFKNRTHPVKKKLRLSTRQKDTRFWKEDPAGMIVKCAEAKALRGAFPSVMASMYLREEMDGVDQEPAILPLGKNRVAGRYQPKQITALPEEESLEEVAGASEPAKEESPLAANLPGIPPREETQKRARTGAPLAGNGEGAAF